ncbi:MAG: hypothetical protein HOK23_06580 [Euryarchaeota archaeon]|jgi:hypothetical protein|nr:hypothetical protein [Euryarchaeota archaeon]
MDYKATLMVLVLVSGSLAGCTGDPDGGGNDEIDSDALQDLFDEHFQDFLNNTTITVINNYHNNTTVVNNDYNNTTINEGDQSSTNNYNNQTENDYSALNYSWSSTGNGSGPMLYLLDVFFTMEELLPNYEAIDHLNNTINYSYTYYDYLTNSERTDVFLIQCNDYYIVGSQSNSSQVSYWNDSSNYRDAWRNVYNDTISDMLYQAATANYYLGSEYGQHVRMACDEDYTPGEGWDDVHLIDIPIPNGMAINLVKTEVYGWCHEEGRWTADGSGYCRSDWDNDGDLQYWDYEHFRVDFVWEDFSDVTTTYPLWIGGDGDTVLSVYLDGLYPNQQYWLRIYFETITVLNVEE